MDNLNKVESQSDVSMLYNYLKCPCCENYFHDKLRALLLKCGHNICNRCLEINKSTYTCLICLVNYKEEDLKNISVNFLLDEMIIKLISNNLIKVSKSDLNDKYQYYCLNCKTLMFSSSFHKKLHNHHKILDYETFKTSQLNMYRKLKEDFMADYQRRISKVQDNISGFTEVLSNQLTESLDEQLNVLNKDKANNLEALKVIDLISEEEYTKLQNFKNSFIDNEEKSNVLLNEINSNSLTDESKKEIEALFRNVLDVEQIFNNKLNNIEVKLSEINSNLNEIDPNKFSDDLAFEISNKIKNMIYSESNKNRYNTVISYFTNDVLYMFDTILCDSSQISFSHEILKNSFEDTELTLKFLQELSEIRNYTVTTDELDGIFITGGVNVINNEYSNKTFMIKKSDSGKLLLEAYPSMNHCRQGHIAIYYDFKLFVFGGIKDKNDKILCEFYDIISGFWIELQTIPIKYTSESARTIISFNKLYYIDGLRHLFSIELHQSDNNFKNNSNWTDHKIYYDNSYNLNLINYAFIGNYIKKTTDEKGSKLYLIGGETSDGININIFSLTTSEKFILKKETELTGFNFKFSNQSANNFNQENNYSYLIGEDDEKKISVLKISENLDIEEIKLMNNLN